MSFLVPKKLGQGLEPIQIWPKKWTISPHHAVLTERSSSSFLGSFSLRDWPTSSGYSESVFNSLSFSASGRPRPYVDDVQSNGAFLLEYPFDPEAQSILQSTRVEVSDRMHLIPSADDAVTQTTFIAVRNGTYALPEEIALLPTVYHDDVAWSRKTTPMDVSRLES